jgi:hypothetical protein
MSIIIAMIISIVRILLPPAVRLAMLPCVSSFGAEYGSFFWGFDGASKALVRFSFSFDNTTTA